MAELNTTALSEHAADWLMLIADASAKAFALLAAAWLAAVLLRRGGARLRHALWSTALAGALLLPLAAAVAPSWRLPLLPVLTVRSPQQDSPAPEVLRRVIEPAAVITPTGLEMVLGVEPTAEPATGLHEPGAAADVPSKPRGLLSLPAALALLGVWLAGAVVMLGWLLAGLIRVTLLTRSAEEAGFPAPNRPIAGLAAQVRLVRPVRVLISDAVAVPVTWGWLRPAVLLPTEARHWSADRRRIVLLHELLHIKRNDWLIQMLAYLACAAYWFNPLAWVAIKRLCAEREQACDDDVIALGTRPSEYASHLLDIARSMTSCRAAPVAALAMARHSQLKGRLMLILDTKRRRRRGAALLPVVCCMAGLVCLLAVVHPWHGAGAMASAALTARVTDADPQEIRVNQEIIRIRAEMAALEEQLEPFNEQIQAIHEQMEPFHEKMQAIQEKMAPFDEAVAVINEQMRPVEEHLRHAVHLDIVDGDLAHGVPLDGPDVEELGFDPEQMRQLEYELQILSLKLEPLRAQIAVLEEEMKPHLQQLDQADDADTIAELEESLAPLREEQRAIEDSIKSIHKAMQGIHGQLKPMHEQIKARTQIVHEKLAPFHQKLQQIHAQMAPIHREVEAVHEEMAPFHSRIEALHVEMEPILKELHLLSTKLGAELRTDVREIILDVFEGLTLYEDPEIAGMLDETAERLSLLIGRMHSSVDEETGLMTISTDPEEVTEMVVRLAVTELEHGGIAPDDADMEELSKAAVLIAGELETLHYAISE